MVDTDGLEWYIVGGWVRDQLLGRDPSDRDIVVVGSTEEEMLDRGFNQPVGESFSVFIHPETGEEWALARTDESTGDAYKDTTVNTDDVSLEEDLHRRDLTVNAIALDPDTEEYIDPVGGMEDLNEGVLRHVGDAFSNDPLRVLRLARFAARLPEFTVADETVELAQDVAPQLEEMAEERIFTELEKTFKQAETPRRFFDILSRVNALSVAFPTLAEMQDVPAGPEEYHGEGSTFEHTMRVLEHVSDRDPGNTDLLFAALAHDFGKVRTDEDDLPSHPLHEKTGLDVVDEFRSRHKVPNDITRTMKSAVRYHMRFHKVDELREKTLIDMVDLMWLDGDEFVTLGVADGLGREPQELGADPEVVREHLDAAESVMEDYTGEDVFEQFDVDPSDGEKIGDLLLQERIRLLKERRP